MSKDIRSFFSIISSNKQQSTVKTPLNETKKRPKNIISSDDDVIPETPSPNKKLTKTVKRSKICVIDSDSEDDKSKSKNLHKKVAKKEQKSKLKPVSVLESLGKEPVKQAPVKKVPKATKQLTQTNDKTKNSNSKLKEFEQTLLELDDDFLESHVNELDKSIDQIVNKEQPNISKLNKPNKLDKSQSSKPTKAPKQPLEYNDIDPDQERYEKKRQSGILYQKYLRRSGPAHHGSKELPKGKPDCLKNLCFIRTGVLDSLQNDEFEELVQEHGGRTVHAVSKKVNYVVAGEDAGPAKLEKAKNYQIKIINEDEFLDLIRTLSGITPINSPDENSSSNSIKPTNSGVSKKKVPIEDHPKKFEKVLNVESLKKKTESMKHPKKIIKIDTNEKNEIKSIVPEQLTKPNLPEGSLPWTEKYKPQNIKSIIGQQTDKSNMKRLLYWLENWHKNHTGINKPKLTRPSPWASNDDGSYFKAALLSGPPGVGKTTTATLVAKELGFDVVEFNASDTRSKRLLHEEVSQLLSTKSLAMFFTDGSAPTSKHVLLMDEVDGMAGNEDRGGMQELIALIKNSNVPIICMCNDRNCTKVRSLANYCMDLRFSRPRLEQIRGAMMTVCYKEGIQIATDALTEVINGANMDIRQILTNLSMWSSGDKQLGVETASKEAKMAKKDVPVGPWEVCRRVFSLEEHTTKTVAERERLFYHDYSLSPLFVHENYLGVLPAARKEDHLKCFADAADAISMGDVVDKNIRQNNNWSLLNVEALFASVLPGYYLRGHMNAQIDFPGWLGKNSRKNKFVRLLSELHAHMRTSVSGSKSAVNLDYITSIRDSIIRPLRYQGVDGVKSALDVMHSYNLLREDFDSIIELAQWPRQKDPMAMIDSKVKAAFTRTYNKDGAKLPYAVHSAPTKKKRTNNDDYNEENDRGEEDSEPEDDDDVNKDAMVKTKTKPAKRSRKKNDAAETSSSSSSTAKTKGKTGRTTNKKQKK